MLMVGWCDYAEGPYLDVRDSERRRCVDVQMVYPTLWV